MNDRCLIFYHGSDWNHTPARQKYLMQALSCYVPVIYLDGGADRRGQVSRTQPCENVTVVRGLIPLLIALQNRRMERLFPPLARRHLRRLTAPYQRVLFWNAENWLRPYRFIRHDALIFDCIDPAFTEDPDALEKYERREQEILREAALVFATADLLAERCRQSRPRVVLLNNACEPAEYAPPLLQAAEKPLWWPETTAPIAAYLGSLDWRFDFPAVEQACRDNPQVQFILAGNILPQFAARVEKLRALPHVLCPGKISVGDGRYLLSRCAVGLIPFTEGPMNDAINPVKMYAYALLGKPIVGTSIRELTSRPDIVTTGKTPDEFSRAIPVAIQRSRDPDAQAALTAFALYNTWELRAAQAWPLLKEL